METQRSRRRKLQRSRRHARYQHHRCPIHRRDEPKRAPENDPRSAPTSHGAPFLGVQRPALMPTLTARRAEYPANQQGNRSFSSAAVTRSEGGTGSVCWSRRTIGCSRRQWCGCGWGCCSSELRRRNTDALATTSHGKNFSLNESRIKCLHARTRRTLTRRTRAS